MDIVVLSLVNHVMVEAGKPILSDVLTCWGGGNPLIDSVVGVRYGG